MFTMADARREAAILNNALMEYGVEGYSRMDWLRGYTTYVEWGGFDGIVFELDVRPHDDVAMFHVKHDGKEIDCAEWHGKWFAQEIIDTGILDRWLE